MLRQESGLLRRHFYLASGEIQRVQEQLASRIGSGTRRLPCTARRRSTISEKRSSRTARDGKVVLATNIAENEFNHRGIRLVVDCAQERVVRLSRARAYATHY
ncbi:hypothetical protein ACNKHV_00920 [Shigella flexneri]